MHDSKFYIFGGQAEGAFMNDLWSYDIRQCTYPLHSSNGDSTNNSVSWRSTYVGTSPIQESRSSKTYGSYHVFACREDLRVSPPTLFSFIFEDWGKVLMTVSEEQMVISTTTIHGVSTLHQANGKNYPVLAISPSQGRVMQQQW
jgi:hypothetical protein